MTEALALRVKKKQQDKLELWAPSEEVGDDDEECASNKLAVVLAEVKGRGADFRNLREVRLVDCLIDDTKLEVLVQLLSEGCVSVLALGGNAITSIGARHLGASSAALAPLRELHLNGNFIADQGIEALCRGLFGHATAAEQKEEVRRAKRLQRMASAKARRMNATGKSASLTPAPKLKESAPSRLAVLDLCANPVSPDGARALAASLCLERCRLTTLRLGGVPKTLDAFKPGEIGERARRAAQVVIGDAGTIMLAGALLLSPALLERKGHGGLETLSLMRCGIGAHGARALAAALYCEPALTQLDVSGNALEGCGVGRSVKERPLASRVLKRGLAEPSVAPRVTGPASITDRTGGLATLGRALEATSSLARVLHDDDCTARYFAAALNLEPPREWSRRRRLGVDAAATREWLLTCFKAEGLELPSPGARETALALEELDEEDPGPLIRVRRPAIAEGPVHPSSFHAAHDAEDWREDWRERNHEKWETTRRREDRELRARHGFVTDPATPGDTRPSSRGVGSRPGTAEHLRTTMDRSPREVLFSLEPASLQAALTAFDFGDDAVTGDHDDSNAACAAWASLEAACGDAWPPRYLEQLTHAPSGDAVHAFHTLRSATDDVPLGLLFPGVDALHERGVPSLARWDALWRCGVCLEVLGRERESRADAARAVLDTSFNTVQKAIETRAARRVVVWPHQAAVDASLDAARAALEQREVVEAQRKRDFENGKDALETLLQDCRLDRTNATLLATDQAKSAVAAAQAAQHARVLLTNAQMTANADREKRRAEGKETLHDTQANALGETNARVVEALRVYDEAAAHAGKTEELRLRALERVQVAKHCFERTYLELLRLKARYAAASAEVQDWQWRLGEFERAEVCRVIERCRNDAPYGALQSSAETRFDRCEEDWSRADASAARAFDLAMRLRAASDERKTRQLHRDQLQDGPCGSDAMDAAVVDASNKRDAADATLAAADAKRRLLVRLNPFASKRLSAELNAHVIAANTWRKTCWQRHGDAVLDAAGYKASIKDGNLTERRKALDALAVRGRHPKAEVLVAAYNAVTVRAVRAVEFERAEENRVRDDALRLRNEQRRDRNAQLDQLSKVDPRKAGLMVVARINAMRGDGVPADKDDLDDLRNLRQAKMRAKSRLRAKETRKLFKKAKALRDDAFAAEEAATNAAQALRDDKERARVDKLLRLEALGLSPPKPAPKPSLWRRVFGARKVLRDNPLTDDLQCPFPRKLHNRVRTKGLKPLPPVTTLIKDNFSTNAVHVLKKKRVQSALPGSFDPFAAISYESDEESVGDIFDDLEIFGE